MVPLIILELIKKLLYPQILIRDSSAKEGFLWEIENDTFYFTFQYHSNLFLMCSLKTWLK